MRQKSPIVWAVIVLLAAELVLVAAITVVLIVDLLTARAASLPSAVALTVLAVIATAWLAAILIGVFRGQAWVRGAAIVWQVLQFAVGIGALQGALAQPVWGWPLIAASTLTFVLLLTRPVVAQLSDREPRQRD
ncbi:MAG TPA: hypothetical protein VNT53_03830 [Pseudolysinimonas sp.]|nr:hypothetical protein [Pseudolysinimonas sp.]